MAKTYTGGFRLICVVCQSILCVTYMCYNYRDMFGNRMKAPRMLMPRWRCQSCIKLQYSTHFTNFILIVMNIFALKKWVPAFCRMRTSTCSCTSTSLASNPGLACIKNNRIGEALCPPPLAKRLLCRPLGYTGVLVSWFLFSFLLLSIGVVNNTEHAYYS